MYDKFTYFLIKAYDAAELISNIGYVKHIDLAIIFGKIIFGIIDTPYNLTRDEFTFVKNIHPLIRRIKITVNSFPESGETLYRNLWNRRWGNAENGITREDTYIEID